MGQPTPKSRFHLFLSWPCLISLALLLLNDYYLKPVLSNWLTGKLSDFAGIFLVSFLAFAMYPQRRKAVGFVLAVSFVLWKTEFVEPAIQLVQTIGVTRFGRVTDLTDVIALSVIPLAAWFAPRQRSCLVSYPRLRTLVTVPAVSIFVVAVTGTSIATFSENYIIQRSSSEVTVDPEGVLEVLNAVAHDHNLERISGDEESYSGEFSNKYFRLTYVVHPNGELEIETRDNYATPFLRGPADKKIKRFRESLVLELGWEFDGLEMVTPIS